MEGAEQQVLFINQPPEIFESKTALEPIFLREAAAVHRLDPSRNVSSKVIKSFSVSHRWDPQKKKIMDFVIMLYLFVKFKLFT